MLMTSDNNLLTAAVFIVDVPQSIAAYAYDAPAHPTNLHSVSARSRHAQQGIPLETERYCYSSGTPSTTLNYIYDYPNVFSWLSRDPLGERINRQGGECVYAFIVNNSINNVDILGLFALDIPDERIVNVCGGDDLGKCSVKGSAGFWCTEAMGEAINTVDIGEYWVAKNTGLFTEQLISAERQHYVAIRAFYNTIEKMVASHRILYGSACKCKKGAEKYNRIRDDLWITLDRYNTNLDKWWHEPLGNKIRTSLCGNNG